MSDYLFKCPVAEGAVERADCEARYGDFMVGVYGDHPPRCMIAMRAGKCAHALFKRREWQSRIALPGAGAGVHEVPADVLNAVMSARVSSTCYGGIATPGSHDEFFEGMTRAVSAAKAPGMTLKAVAKERDAAEKPAEKPAEKDALGSVDYADAVTRMVAQEAAAKAKAATAPPAPPQAPPAAKAAPKVIAQPKAATPPQPAPAAAGGMTLAERAKAMRAARAEQV